MAAVNGASGYGLGNEAPYLHVIGLPFNAPLLASLEVLRTAENVTEMDNILQSPTFHAKMEALGELEPAW